MKRVSYGLLLLAAMACSVCLGIMTYVSALDSEAAEEQDRQNLQMLEQESWYLPLSEEYDSIHQIAGADRELYGARYQDKEILMDRTGKAQLTIPENLTVFEPQKGWVSSEMDCDGEGENLLRYYDKAREKYGFMNLRGKVVIEAAYEQATEFTDGYAIAQDTVGGHPSIMIIIDQSGRMAYNPSAEGQWFEWFTSVKRLGGSRFLLKDERGSKGRIFDAKEKTVLKEMSRSGGYLDMKNLGEERWARIGDSYLYLLDEDFEPVSEDAYLWMDRFSEGLCFVKWNEGTKTRCGYIDGSGKVQIAVGDVICGSRFKEGKAFLWTEDRVRVIDRTGRTLFEKELAEALDPDYYQIESRYDEVRMELTQLGFRDDLAVCYDGRYFGILDAKGTWRIPPILDFAEFCGRDAAVLRLGAKEGIWKAGGRDER